MPAKKLPVYLDYSATTPVDPQVLEAMLPFFTEHFGNASSTNHPYGRKAAEAVQQAREQVAQLIGAIPEEIIFTAGATESINLAIKGVFETYSTKGNHIITTQTEHSAVLKTCAALEQRGAEITYVPVNADGRVDVAVLEKAIRPGTLMIVAMYANNETGVIQPVHEIGELARKRNIIFFTDAVQAVGKIPVDVIKSNIGLLAMSAHKLYGPKGIGALYVRRKDPRVQLSVHMHGGGQEKGKRSGTLNVPGIVGFGAAAAICHEKMYDEAKRLNRLRNGLEEELLAAGALVNGSREYRLPQVTSLSFNGAQPQALLSGLYPYVAASGGSACATGTYEPSHVLKAMGLTDERALGALRLSLGRFTTEEETAYAAAAIIKVVSGLQEITVKMTGDTGG